MGAARPQPEGSQEAPPLQARHRGPVLPRRQDPPRTLRLREQAPPRSPPHLYPGTRGALSPEPTYPGPEEPPPRSPPTPARGVLSPRPRSTCPPPQIPGLASQARGRRAPMSGNLGDPDHVLTLSSPYPSPDGRPRDCTGSRGSGAPGEPGAPRAPGALRLRSQRARSEVVLIKHILK